VEYVTVVSVDPSDKETLRLGEIQNLHIDVDASTRAWIDDVAVVQWYYHFTDFGLWERADRTARETFEVVERALNRGLIGATLHFLVVGNENRTKALGGIASLTSLNQMAQPVITDVFKGVTVDTIRVPKYEEELSLGVHVLTSEEPLSDVETQGFLQGLDAVAIRPEVLAHKAAWSARQLLEGSRYSKLKSNVSESLILSWKLQSDALNPKKARRVLKEVNSKMISLSGLRSTAQAVVNTLDAQARHLQSPALKIGFEAINSAYARRTLNACESIQAVQIDLDTSYRALSECSLLVRAGIAVMEAETESRRDQRSRRVEAWVASIGVGIGLTGLISEGVGAQFAQKWLYGSEPFVISSTKGNWEVLAVRASFVLLSSLVVFCLYRRGAKAH